MQQSVILRICPDESNYANEEYLSVVAVKQSACQYEVARTLLVYELCVLKNYFSCCSGNFDDVYSAWHFDGRIRAEIEQCPITRYRFCRNTRSFCPSLRLQSFAPR